MRSEQEIKDRISLLEAGLNGEMNEWVKEKVRLEINVLTWMLGSTTERHKENEPTGIYIRTS